MRTISWKRGLSSHGEREREASAFFFFLGWKKEERWAFESLENALNRIQCLFY